MKEPCTSHLPLRDGPEFRDILPKKRKAPSLPDQLSVQSDQQIIPSDINVKDEPPIFRLSRSG